MGQAEVLKFLEENPGWHPTKSISEALSNRMCHEATEVALKILKKNREVEWKMADDKKSRLYRFLLPAPRGRNGRTVENRIGQAWKSGKKQVIGKDIFGNSKVFSMPDGHFQCPHCLTVVRIDERGFAACVNCGMIYNDGKIDEKMSNRERKRREERFKYECCNTVG